MKIILNGKPRECSQSCSVQDLLDELKAVPDQVAIVLNEDVVPAKRRPNVVLKEGDRIEILTLAAGG
jgi:thiamine biosynthesis protein ThiS